MSSETEPPASSHPRVHRLGPNDLSACLALDQAALSGLWTAAQWQEELRQPERLCMGLVSEQGLIALACGWLVLDELQIGAVAVMPDQRRQGHGERALRALLQEAGRRGALNATLEVSSSNTAATALYQRCGFATAGIRRGYYRNGDDALIQWLRL